MLNFQKLNIIMFGMSDYTDWRRGIANRNYHILQTLAKDERIDKIVAVDFLPIGFSWQRKVKYFYRNLIKGVNACDVEKKICIYSETKFGDLTSRCYQINSKIYVYSSIDNLNKVTKELAEVKKRLDLDNLVVWSYNPLIPDLKSIKDKLGANVVVFDAVDDWSKHGVYKNRKEVLEKNYQMIRERADVIFTVSKELQEGVFNDLSDKVHWIPNGVDVEKFAEPPMRLPQDLINIKQPIIGYEGVIQDRLDIDLIKYLAEKNRDKSFVFVGWLWRGLDEVINREFVNLENVHFLGRKTYNELSDYIHSFKVAIIPHKINEFTKSMNPLKMYEYLASGKPVVSTDVSGVGGFGDLIKIAKNKEEFNQFINDALVEDSEELKNRRVEAVREHSWEKRVEAMLSLLS